MMFQKPALLLFSDKEAPNLVYPYTELFSITTHHRHSNLLRYAPENRSSPRVVIGKLPLKNSKLITRLKNKTWSNPQIKNHKKKNTCSIYDSTNA
jgi:hypothetical protein